MASGKELTPSEYIEHHLTFLTKPVSGDGGFWSINVDSLVTAVILGSRTPAQLEAALRAL